MTRVQTMKVLDMMRDGYYIMRHAEGFVVIGKEELDEKGNGLHTSYRVNSQGRVYKKELCGIQKVA